MQRCRARAALHSLPLGRLLNSLELLQREKNPLSPPGLCQTPGNSPSHGLAQQAKPVLTRSERETLLGVLG